MLGLLLLYVNCNIRIERYTLAIMKVITYAWTTIIICKL